MERLRKEIGTLEKNEEDVLTFAMFPELGREYLQERQDGTLKPEKLLPVGEKGAQSAMATEFKIQVHGETYEVAVTGVGVSSSDQKKIRSEEHTSELQS